nr:hypothetical protein [Leptospira interrogans]
MKQITFETNFCRLFLLPEKYPEGFLFGGSKPVIFALTDWFNPVSITAISKDEPIDWKSQTESLKEFIRNKSYIQKGRKYLLLTDFDEAIVIDIPK